jgi:hypothetical protein
MKREYESRATNCRMGNLLAHAVISKIEHQGSCIENMKNEPNFTTRKPNKHENGVVLYYHFFKKNHQLFKKYQKKIQNKRILQISDINTLNSMYNKDLHKYSHQNPNHSSRNARYKKMKNEANFKHSAPRITGHGPRVTGHKSRVTILAKRTQFDALQKVLS